MRLGKAKINKMCVHRTILGVLTGNFYVLLAVYELNLFISRKVAILRVLVISCRWEMTTVLKLTVVVDV